MVLSLRYGDLSSTVSETNKLANELGQYCDDLSRKVQQKMYSIEGGMSSALNSADYYVNAKIKQLRAREGNARNLSVKTQTLFDTAKRVDSDVERTIQANQKSFFKKNSHLKPSDFKLKVTSFLCDLKNGLKNVPILGDIIKGGEKILDAWNTLKNEIRHWWRAGGGMELITNVFDIVVKIGLAAAAVVTFIGLVLSGAGIIVLIAAGLLAVIGVVNMIVNTATSIQAIQAGSDHPAMSRIYADRDKLSDVLREENFHDRFWNRASNVAATTLDITETVCEVVLIVESLGKAFKYFKGKDLGKLFNASFKQRSTLGTFLPGKASIWNATQTFTLKNWVFGGLQLSKDFSKLNLGKQLVEVGKLIKAISSTLDGLNKVLKGEDKWWEFGGSLVMDRVYTNLDTNRFIENTRKIVDKLGITKLITNIDPSGTLTKINDSPSGLIQKLESIYKSATWKDPLQKFLYDNHLPQVTIPEISLDLTVLRERLAKLQNGVISGVSRRTFPNYKAPTIILPQINLLPKFEIRYPYYAVAV